MVKPGLEAVVNRGSAMDGRWVIKKGTLYYKALGAGTVQYTSSLSEANRFESIMDAAFIANRIGGTVVPYRKKPNLEGEEA